MITFTLYNPAGTAYDVTTGRHSVLLESLPGITKQLEDSLGEYTSGDVDVLFANDDGWFDTQWTFPSDPEQIYDESTGNGCWVLQISKGGSVRWVGDLDVRTIDRNTKDQTIGATFVGKLGRLAHYNAELVKRDIPASLTWTYTTGPSGTWSKRILQNTAATIASLHLVPKDVIRITKLKGDGKIITQDIEILDTPATDPSLNAYQIKSKTRLKAKYTSDCGSSCITPYYRDLSVGTLVGYLFDHAHISNREINYTAFSNDLVPYADFDGKNVADALVELASIVGAALFTTPTKYYFVGRDLTKSGTSAKNIDSLVLNEDLSGLWENFYNLVEVTGSRDGVYSRRGGLTYPESKLDIKTDYVDSIDWLGQIADRAYSIFGVRRTLGTFEVIDNGTVYEIWDEITRTVDGATTTFMIIQIEESLEEEDTIKLTAIARDGTAASTSDGESQDEAVDHSPPPPPTNLEVYKVDGSEPSMFRTLFPASDFPKIVKTGQILVPGTDPPEYKRYKKQLYCIRFKWAWDDKNGRLLGFHGVKYKDGRDPERKSADDNAQDLQVQSDGYYYFPPSTANHGNMCYCRKGIKHWFYFEAVTNDGQVSAPCEEVSTATDSEDSDNSDIWNVPTQESAWTLDNATISDSELTLSPNYYENASARLLVGLPKYKLEIMVDWDGVQYGEMVGVLDASGNGYLLRLNSLTQIELFRYTNNSPTSLGAATVSGLVQDFYQIRFSVHKKKIVVVIGEQADRVAWKDHVHRIKGWNLYINIAPQSSQTTISAVVINSGDDFYQGVADSNSLQWADSDGCIDFSQNQLDITGTKVKPATLFSKVGSVIGFNGANVYGNKSALTPSNLPSSNFAPLDMYVSYDSSAIGSARYRIYIAVPQNYFGSGNPPANRWYIWKADNYLGGSAADTPAGGSAGTGGTCWADYMEIDTPTGSVALSDIQVGQRITSHDWNTGEDIEDSVLSVKYHTVKKWLIINGTLVGTSEHYVFGEGLPNKAILHSLGSLRPGIKLRGRSGPVEVKTIEKKTGELRVASIETRSKMYIVGGVLAHNAKDVGL